MQKETLLKSLYIGFQEDGTPGEVQIQRVERWTGLPEGAVIDDKYLDVDRQGYASLSPEHRKIVKGVLGATAAAQTEKLIKAQARVQDLEAALHDTAQDRDGAYSLAAEQQARVGELEATVQALEAARELDELHIQGLMADSQRREMALTDLLEELKMLRDPAPGPADAQTAPGEGA